MVKSSLAIVSCSKSVAIIERFTTSVFPGGSVAEWLRRALVQSLNSPFFPPHIGAEPGRAKEESRITCMRMLRTNQSKITCQSRAYAGNLSLQAKPQVAENVTLMKI